MRNCEEHEGVPSKKRLDDGFGRGSPENEKLAADFKVYLDAKLLILCHIRCTLLEYSNKGDVLHYNSNFTLDVPLWGTLKLWKD